MTVPLWAHILIVVTLLGTHAMTVAYTRKRISDLQVALMAKRALLGYDIMPNQQQHHTLKAGESFVLMGSAGIEIVRVENDGKTVDVKVHA